MSPSHEFPSCARRISVTQSRRGFEVGDVNRLPSSRSTRRLRYCPHRGSVTVHERARESSVEFRGLATRVGIPQSWAQVAVDRAELTALPPYALTTICRSRPRTSSSRSESPWAARRKRRRHPRQPPPDALPPASSSSAPAKRSPTSLDHRRRPHPRRLDEHQLAILAEGQLTARLAAQGLRRVPQGPLREPPHLLSALDREEELRRWVSIHTLG